MQEESSEEFKESVCSRFGTSLAQVKKDVETLREWLKTQHHLPQCASDNMLTSCLLSSKNSMERAKQKIDNYYTVRGQMPDMFSERDPTTQRVRDVSEEMPMFTLPKLTPDGCRVVFGYIATGDAEKYDLPAFSKRYTAFEDLVLINREPYVNGYYYVYDSGKVSMAHIKRLSPSIVRQIIICTQDVYPVRIKGIIFINAPSIIDLLLNIMKPFMKSKLISRMHVHSEGPEVLEKYFPRDMLPEDYGGKEPNSTILQDLCQKYIEERKDWLLNEGSELTVEKKRIKETSSGSKNMDYIQGSFKTLCVD